MRKPSGNRPLVVGIAGGSGCGKTYLARQVVSEIGEDWVALLSMDQYFRNDALDGQDPRGINFDHPSHLDFRLLIRHLAQLRSGRTIWAPQYDFHTMTQTPRSIRIEPKRILIVEGLFVLSEPMVSLCDLTCFLDVAADERLMGRLLRDLQERGGEVNGIIDRYQRFVRPGYQIFINPTKQNADVVVDFTYRRAMFSQLLISLLSAYAKDGLEVEDLLRTLRSEAYPFGTGGESGFMSITTDIFKLARAYPEKSMPETMPRPMTSPAATRLGRDESQPPENR